MSMFDEDRPEGYDAKGDDKYPYVRHEDLSGAEKLKLSAKDLEDAVEHYDGTAEAHVDEDVDN